MRRKLVLGASATLATLAILGGVATADDGGVMQRFMGHDAYIAMVDHMRLVLGNERADAMIASCEAAMASSGGAMDKGAMQQMMSGMGAMMGR
jgi:hypothetical protein